MKVGDLLKDNKIGPEYGMIVDVVPDSEWKYRILCADGGVRWFSADMIEGRCEVISEGRRLN
jgi:hypothetical protein